MNCVVLEGDGGFYVGLMTGPATNTGGTVQAQMANSTNTTPVTPNTNQFGTRIFLGNKLSRYAGLEAGMAFFSTIHYDDNGVDTCSSLSSRVRDIDVVARGSFPLKSIELVAKAGAAAVYTTTPGPFYSPPAGKTCGQSKNEIKFRPTMSIGLSYDLSPSWVLDTSWTRILVGGTISNVNFYGFGISYHFVDRYCGQFLCG